MFVLPEANAPVREMFLVGRPVQASARPCRGGGTLGTATAFMLVLAMMLMAGSADPGWVMN
jgi:hypothetical protein